MLVEIITTISYLNIVGASLCAASMNLTYYARIMDAARMPALRLVRWM
jgi:hypothetical protein